MSELPELPHACELMRIVLEDGRSALEYDPSWRDYTIAYLGDGPVQRIEWCPFCGARLPLSLRDAWLTRRDELGIEPGGELPPEMRDDRWWRTTRVISDDAAEAAGLAHVWLEESPVFEVTARPGSLTLLIHTHLLPEHPEYREPSDDEWGTYQWGRLEFEGVEEFDLGGHPTGPAGPWPGFVDYGEIYALHRDGPWFVLEDFYGPIRVRGGVARFELEPATWSPPAPVPPPWGVTPSDAPIPGLPPDAEP